jgi:predicted AAA+ superfamily ATPase
MIHRDLQTTIQKYLNKNKAIVIYGARQVGKTTLSLELTKQYAKPLYLSCDNPTNASLFSNASLEKINSITRGYDCLVLDEAQKITNIGNVGKMIVDNKLVKQLLMTGSSSLDLANTVKEPMTGRIFEFKLYPISYHELLSASDYPHIDLEDLLIYGSYPEVVTASSMTAEKIISQISEQYTFKDIFDTAEIRDPGLINRLLIALALQLGSEVSYNELATMLEVNRLTIERYIWLLENAFIVYRLNALTGNPRKMISLRKRKIYFNDLGIRNALVNDFRPLEFRDDKGALFENFCINERNKLFANGDKSFASYYFRSAKTKAELDYVEDFDGTKKAYEFKWKADKFKTPGEFVDKYPTVKPELININKYIDFVTKI